MLWKILNNIDLHKGIFQKEKLSLQFHPFCVMAEFIFIYNYNFLFT